MIRPSCLCLGPLSLCVVMALGSPHLTADETKIDFNRQIRPLLADNCLRCHGPDAATRESGLRLDIREDAIAELDSGSVAIVPGKPAESELLARISTADEDERMKRRRSEPRRAPFTLLLWARARTDW